MTCDVFVFDSMTWSAVVSGTGGAWYYVGLGMLGLAMLWGIIVAYHSWEEAHEELDPVSREEMLDAFRTGSDSSYKDLAFDALGIATGLVISWLVDFLIEKFAPQPWLTRGPG